MKCDKCKAEPGIYRESIGYVCERCWNRFLDRLAKWLEDGVRITPDLLQAVMPRCRRDRAEQFAEPFTVTLREHDISTPLRAAHFFAQVGHESASLRWLEENLNYSQKGLLLTFGHRLTALQAARLARKPIQTANAVYANRYGNGPPESGDGWRFRGRGLIQLTFRSNYEAYWRDRKDFLEPYADPRGKGWTLMDWPDIVSELPEIAADVAGWYWTSRGLNKWADKDDARRITKLINGGYNGLEDRLKRLEIAKEVLL